MSELNQLAKDCLMVGGVGAVIYLLVSGAEFFLVLGYYSAKALSERQSRTRQKRTTRKHLRIVQ